MNSDNCFEESTPKYLLDVKSPGFDMYTDNFEVTIKSETRETLFHKSDLVEETVTEGGQTKHYYYVSRRRSGPRSRPYPRTERPSPSPCVCPGCSCRSPAYRSGTDVFPTP